MKFSEPTFAQTQLVINMKDHGVEKTVKLTTQFQDDTNKWNWKYLNTLKSGTTKKEGMVH